MTEILLRTVRRVGTSGAPADVRIVDGRVAEIAPAGTLDPMSVDTDVVEAAAPGSARGSATTTRTSTSGHSSAAVSTSPAATPPRRPPTCSPPSRSRA